MNSLSWVEQQNHMNEVSDKLRNIFLEMNCERVKAALYVRKGQHIRESRKAIIRELLL